MTMSDKKLTTQEKIKKTIETYNKYAAVYAEKTQNKLLQFQLSKFVSMLVRKAKVLDAGCGCGRDSAYLLEDGLDVSSVDLSIGMIEESKKRGVIAIKGDLLTMKSNEEFDGIWCMTTIGNIPKVEAPKLLKNFYKALKKEGIMYLSAKKGNEEKFVEKRDYDGSPIFYAFYEKDELDKLVTETGFDIIESTIAEDDGKTWIEIFARKS